MLDSIFWVFYFVLFFMTHFSRLLCKILSAVPMILLLYVNEKINNLVLILHWILKEPTLPDDIYLLETDNKKF